MTNGLGSCDVPKMRSHLRRLHSSGGTTEMRLWWESLSSRCRSFVLLFATALHGGAPQWGNQLYSLKSLSAAGARTQKESYHRSPPFANYDLGTLAGARCGGWVPKDYLKIKG